MMIHTLDAFDHDDTGEYVVDSYTKLILIIGYMQMGRGKLIISVCLHNVIPVEVITCQESRVCLCMPYFI